MKKPITYRLREKSWGYIFYLRNDITIPEYISQKLPTMKVIWLRVAEGLDFENENGWMTSKYTRIIREVQRQVNRTLLHYFPNVLVVWQGQEGRWRLTASLCSEDVNIVATLERFRTAFFVPPLYTEAHLTDFSWCAPFASNNDWVKNQICHIQPFS